MANIKLGVTGPDGNSGLKNRDVIAKLHTAPDKNGSMGYYMNAQLAQYNGSPNAKGYAQTSPQLAWAHDYGDGKKSYDLRISQSQYDAILSKANVVDGPKGSKIAGFKSDLIKCADNGGYMPNIETIKPTTSSRFNDKAWQAQQKATEKAFQKSQAAKAKVAAVEAQNQTTAEAEAPEVPTGDVPEM